MIGSPKKRGLSFMLNEAWKRRLIHIAHSGSGKEFNLKTRMAFPKTVLGQKIHQRKTMNYTFPWLHKIKGKVLQDELLASHTSIQIGGPADVLIFPKEPPTLLVHLIILPSGSTINLFIPALQVYPSKR